MDGDVVRGDGWTLAEAIATPGHTANHMAFAFKEANLIFSGDHVIGVVDAGGHGATGRLHGRLAWLRCKSSRSRNRADLLPRATDLR